MSSTRTASADNPYQHPSGVVVGRLSTAWQRGRDGLTPQYGGTTPGTPLHRAYQEGRKAAKAAKAKTRGAIALKAAKAAKAKTRGAIALKAAKAAKADARYIFTGRRD